VVLYAGGLVTVASTVVKHLWLSYDRSVVALDKSSLLLMIMFTNTQTLFTKKIKNESIYKSY
jgi:hypothetical protein